MELSIIIPTINSEKMIGNTISYIKKYLEANKKITRYEIIVSAQTSTDKTIEVLQGIRGIRLVFSTIVGKGAGLTNGIKNAKYGWVLMIDDDLSYPIAFLDDVFSQLNYDDYDIIIGSRYMIKQKIPLKRRIPSIVYHSLARLFFGINVRDIQSGLKLIRKRIFDDISIQERGYVWDTELLFKAKKR